MSLSKINNTKASIHSVTTLEALKSHKMLKNNFYMIDELF